MVGAPLLSCLSCSIVNDEYSVAIHAVDNGLGHRCTRLDGAYAANMFEDGSERFTHGTVYQVFAYLVAYAVYAGLLSHACYNNLVDVVFFAKFRLTVFLVVFCLCGVGLLT